MVCLKNDFLEVEISTKGAEVKRIFHRQWQLEYLWNGDPAYWNRCSPVLFPIVGKLKNNTYTYRGKPYMLTQHGFARDTEFKVEASEPSRAVFSITSTPSTKDIYPFDFKLYIRYELNGSSLQVSYEVCNTGTEELLFSIGAHPGFHCPLEGGLRFEDYKLTFEQPEEALRLLVGTQGISRSTERVFADGSADIPLTFELFGAKDAIIFNALKSSRMTLHSEQGQRGLHFYFEGFPYMGIWTKPGPFLCIEPWYGIADFEEADGQLEHKEGMLRLNEGQRFEASYRMEFF